ncbi:P-loop containing nucleoside triphosphate hydrolase protein [Ascobolus immersus RN42]|uniref:P-loop containing nucleoside triphosphate hydrolase protein n=1 Tax=Ascobolus immersus RN42 TaxID=1160509 RepID=A0A3N4HXM5_ASCIM|nr:P-loop containing nucleoside triphosphate hydrolase protein [Ascobolus immersus RN42]
MAGAPHTTLIVCPLALLHQWKSEIEKHTEPGKLRKRDIVITTYQMVAQSYPNPNKVEPPKELPSSEREGYIAREFARARGNLHSVDYFRVIFDESHRIRNPETHTSCASMALALRARHRWCLTGTPIFNKLKDLYPAFNIIKMPGLGASAERFYYFLSRSSNQQKAMRLVLQYAMVRRSKIDSFLGKPLVELPPKVIRDILISFDPDTRALYDEIADKAREKLNKLSKESNSKSKKSALKTKKSIEFLWLMLLRLRQLCLHPYLLGDALEKWRDGQFTHCIGACDNYYSTEYGSQALEDSRKAELQPSSRIWKNKTRPVKEHVRRMRVNVRDEHIRRLQDIIHKEPAMQWGPKKDEEGMDVEAEEKALQNCPYCHKELELPVVLTACQHAFCEPCIKEAIQIATETNQIYPCDICRESVKEGDLVLLKDTRSIEVKKKKKNSDTRSIEKVSPSKEPDDPREIQKRLAKEFNENISDRFFLTPKLKAIKTQLVKWKTSRPGEKVVIFSNFNKSLDIIEKMVDEEGWSTARYDGGKTIVDRESALQKFATEPDCWIMLISIKAGGEGLNLTHASLVLTVDPWWNAAVEKQAFDRVHRIGQKKEVEVVRIIVEKSVEIRILEIQTRKLDISAEALGEGKYRDPKAQMAGMSQRQLMSLFGAVYTDSEGRLMVRRD